MFWDCRFWNPGFLLQESGCYQWATTSTNKFTVWVFVRDNLFTWFLRQKKKEWITKGILQKIRLYDGNLWPWIGWSEIWKQRKWSCSIFSPSFAVLLSVISVLTVKLEKKSVKLTVQEIIWGTPRRPPCMPNSEITIKIFLYTNYCYSFIFFNWRILFLDNLCMSMFRTNCVKC